MATDLEIIEELEKEIGEKIPRSSIYQHAIIIPGPNAVECWISDGHVIALMLDFDSLSVGVQSISRPMVSLPTSINRLKHLKTLSLYGNSLTEFPMQLFDLPRLRHLNLSGNKIKELPREIFNLDLRVDPTFSIGPTFKVMPQGTRIVLNANPLESPPVEIIEKGRDAVIEYFNSLEGQALLPLNEVKVLLVGEGGAGKTCLVKRLLRENFDPNEPQTHGINIRGQGVQVGDKNIRVNLWDFGGQEIMHATHQFFLSKRSLYVLVLDGRKDEDAEYWLKHIESFGGNSSILVVLNKMDENPGFDVNRKFLKEKYKGIKGFYRVSCATGLGIEEFSESLSMELADVEILSTGWAESWFNVKTQLENMKDHFISYDDYREICETANIKGQSAQDTLAEFLNDLGVILHFKDIELLDTHVLEPKWITSAVYRIINSDKLAKSRGVLDLNLLGDILGLKQAMFIHLVDMGLLLV